MCCKFWHLSRSVLVSSNMDFMDTRYDQSSYSELASNSWGSFLNVLAMILVVLRSGFGKDKSGTPLLLPVLQKHGNTKTTTRTNTTATKVRNKSGQLDMHSLS